MVLCHKIPAWIFNVCMVTNHLWFDLSSFQATQVFFFLQGLLCTTGRAILLHYRESLSGMVKSAGFDVH